MRENSGEPPSLPSDSEMSPSPTWLQYHDTKWEVKQDPGRAFLMSSCFWRGSVIGSSREGTAGGTQTLHRAFATEAASFPGSGKSVTWKLGADNDVWVWVMGEHPSDKPYAAICEEIQAERAKRLARERGQEGR